MAAERPQKRSMSLCDIALGIGDGNIMPMPFADVALPHWDIHVPPVPEPALIRPAAAASSADGIKAPKLKGKSARLPPAAEEALSRAAMLRAWILIVEELGPAFKINAHETEWSEEVMEPYFSTKRTGTMSCHASAWRLFLKYAAAKGMDVTGLDEHMAHQYLRHLVNNSAPPPGPLPS